jgi:hypothetical protein
MTMYPSAAHPTKLAQLHDQARREARRLRREAVDEFWREAHAMVLRGACRIGAAWSRGIAQSANVTKA